MCYPKLDHSSSLQAPVSCMMPSADVLPRPSPAQQPLFSFGVISDVQYADIPDGCSFLGVPRYYRHSLEVLQRAVNTWNENKKLKFVVNFGDLVDGYCPKEKSLAEVEKLTKEFDKFNGDVYHIIGNHCLYNLPRSTLLKLFKTPSSRGCAYYDVSLTPEYRFVVLDGFDISAIGWPQDHPKTLAALKFLEEKNPNTNKNSTTNLVGLERRFVKFNGGIGKEQLEWLDNILQECTQQNQKVIIGSHVPLDPGAAVPEGLLWNYEEVMAVIHKYNCVKVCIAGHDHRGGYSVDAYGIHHRVLEAALECPPGLSSFGIIDVYNDRLSLSGTDVMTSSEMIFST